MSSSASRARIAEQRLKMYEGMLDQLKAARGEEMQNPFFGRNPRALQFYYIETRRIESVVQEIQFLMACHGDAHE